MVLQIDVLIPHFTDAQGLVRSLKSLGEQTWEGQIRAVVHDDGSPAPSAQDARSICAQFAVSGRLEIEFEASMQNLGRPATRNALLARARAPYLGWLDAGDIWYPEKLEHQFAMLQQLEEQGHDTSRLWVSCSYDWDQAGRVHTRTQNIRGDQVRSLLMGDDLRAYLWTVMGRSEAFVLAGHFDPRLPRLQDLDYFLTFVRAGGRIVVPDVAAPLCRYFKSHIGRDSAQIEQCHDLIMRKSAPLTRRYPRKDRARLAYKGNMLPADFARANGNWGAALAYRARALVVAPDHACRIFAYKVKRGGLSLIRRLHRSLSIGRP